MLPHPPIFILSCYRSGSTLLRFVLDSHPEVCCPPELSFGQAAETLTHLYSGVHGRRYTGAGEAPAPVLDAVRNLLSTVAEGVLASQGKSRFCEKSPSNVLYLPLLDALFPGARWLCLYRQARDVISSTIEMHASIPELARFVYDARGDLVTAFAGSWIEWTGIMLELEKAHPESCFRLRYEDLVANPRDRTAEAFAFLGLDYEPALVDSVFQRPHAAGREDPYIRFSASIHAQSVGAGGKLSLDHLRSDLRERLDQLLCDLGYTAARGTDPALEPDRESGSCEWLLGVHLPRQIRKYPELVETVDTAFRLIVKDTKTRDWLIDLRAGRAQVLPGGTGANFTVEAAAADLLAIARGRLNPRRIFEEGRLKIAGKYDPEALPGLARLLHLPDDAEIGSYE
jgi:protein-tyrosine sulfotransferase